MYPSIPALFIRSSKFRSHPIRSFHPYVRPSIHPSIHQTTLQPSTFHRRIDSSFTPFFTVGPKPFPGAGRPAPSPPQRHHVSRTLRAAARPRSCASVPRPAHRRSGPRLLLQGPVRRAAQRLQGALVARPAAGRAAPVRGFPGKRRPARGAHLSLREELRPPTQGSGGGWPRDEDDDGDHDDDGDGDGDHDDDDDDDDGDGDCDDADGDHDCDDGDGDHDGDGDGSGGGHGDGGDGDGDDDGDGDGGDGDGGDGGGDGDGYGDDDDDGDGGDDDDDRITDNDQL